MAALALAPRRLLRRRAAGQPLPSARRESIHAAPRMFVATPETEADEISRVVLSGAAVGTMVSTACADINRTHMFNPAWPRHARLHNGAGWGTIVALQLFVLWLLWRPRGDASNLEADSSTVAVLPVAA
jgi:Family of unknown function (DUF6640)